MTYTNYNKEYPAYFLSFYLCPIFTKSKKPYLLEETYKTRNYLKVSYSTPIMSRTDLRIKKLKNILWS